MKLKTILIWLMIVLLCFSVIASAAKTGAVRAIRAKPILAAKKIDGNASVATAARPVVAKVQAQRVKRLKDLVKKRPALAKKIKNLSEEKINRLAVLPRALQKRLIANKIRMSTYNITPINKTLMFRKRIIAPNKLRIAEKKYVTAKQRYIEAKTNYELVRNRFLTAKLKRNLTSNKTKAYLLKTADIMLNMLEKVKSKVEANENIDEEKAQDIISQLDEKIAKLQEAKSIVETAETDEEIREAAKVIFSIWRFTKPQLHRNINRLVNTKIGEVIKRSENLEVKLECAIELMKEKGVDTTDIDDKLSEFSELVAEARDLYEQAFKLIKEGSDTDVRKDTKEAHKKLRQAHTLLKEILIEIRNAGIDLGSCKQQMFIIEAAQD